MPDAHANFAYSLVAVVPSPSTTGTQLQVHAGDGALFPTPPFNATIWAQGVLPLASTAEIVRVTAVSSDTLVIVRAQEGTTARIITTGDQIAASITAKTIGDIETLAAAALKASSNLADVASAATARANLGLGTAATHPATDFDPAGAAAAAQTASAPAAATTTALAATEKTANKGQPGGYAPLSASSGDTGKAIDAYTGQPLVVVSSTGSTTRSFIGPAASIQPLIDALPSGTEYVWLETDGTGVKIATWADVAA